MSPAKNSRDKFELPSKSSGFRVRILEKEEDRYVFGVLSFSFREEEKN